jgi:hypothetical protein
LLQGENAPVSRKESSVTLEQYRAENPDLDHVPDEEVEKLLAYQGWRLGLALDAVERPFIDAFNGAVRFIRSLSGGGR